MCNAYRWIQIQIQIRLFDIILQNQTWIDKCILSSLVLISSCVERRPVLLLYNHGQMKVKHCHKWNFCRGHLIRDQMMIIITKNMKMDINLVQTNFQTIYLYRKTVQTGLWYTQWATTILTEYHFVCTHCPWVRMRTYTYTHVKSTHVSIYTHIHQSA